MAIGSIASQWDSEMRVSLWYRLEYAVVMTIRAVVRVLPRRVSLSFGTAVGWIFYLLHGRRRELAMSNLRITFPKRTDFECRTILRATFAQLGRHCIDFLNFDAMEADEMLKLVEFEGEEHVNNAIAQGRGVMYFAGHFGAWELQIMVHAFRFQRIVMVARTLDNSLLETLIERIRTRVGTQVLPTRCCAWSTAGAQEWWVSRFNGRSTHPGPECCTGQLPWSTCFNHIYDCITCITCRRTNYSGICYAITGRALSDGVRETD